MWHFATTTHCNFKFWKNLPTLYWPHIWLVGLRWALISPTDDLLMPAAFMPINIQKVSYAFANDLACNCLRIISKWIKVGVFTNPMMTTRFTVYPSWARDIFSTSRQATPPIRQQRVLKAFVPHKKKKKYEIKKRTLLRWLGKNYFPLSRFPYPYV